MSFLAFLARHFPGLQRGCYLSTTGVYGNHHGALVDETSDCRPTRPRSIQRLEDEAAWQQACRERGVLVGKGGLKGNAIRISPPLTVTREAAGEAVRVFGEALSSVEAGGRVA